MVGYIRSAPWTFGWITLLLVTTIIQHSVSASTLDRILGARSTNLHNLHEHPVRVLFQSLLWIDGNYWLPYLFLFIIFHATAERWLGSVRWLTVGLTAHVAATYISQGILLHIIRSGSASHDMVNTRDVGVSYFLAAIVGVLVYHIAWPWRWVYLAGALVVFGLPLIGGGFTDVGHFTSLVIGFAFYPLTKGRPNNLYDPMDTYRWCRARLATPSSAP